MVNRRLSSLVLIFSFGVLATCAFAVPVESWQFISWGAPKENVVQDIAAAKLETRQAGVDEFPIAMTPSLGATHFVVDVPIYGVDATAIPFFKNGGLTAVRFVVTEPTKSNCNTVLSGLEKDFGPGELDKGFSNVNWPTTDQFALTVVVVTDVPDDIPQAAMCWPLFSDPS